MSLRWSVGLLVCVANPVVPGVLRAQTATPMVLTKGSVPTAKHRFTHHKKLHALYDSVGDSTHLTIVTHKGKYFLTIQRPRLTWTVTYAGQLPGPEAPTTVELEFRTQAPQVARDSRLVIAYAQGQSLDVASAGAFSDPGTQTWSHFMRFPVPSAGLAAVLAGTEVTVTVGGITERFKPDQIEALREPPRPGGCVGHCPAPRRAVPEPASAADKRGRRWAPPESGPPSGAVDHSQGGRTGAGVAAHFRPATLEERYSWHWCRIRDLG